MKTSKLIASVVVFKELLDSDKDIYDIISEFIKSAVLSNNKWKFNSTEIKGLIEHEFDFELPEAVIKTTLKRRLAKAGFLNFESGEYHVTKVDSFNNKEFEDNYTQKKDLYKRTEEEFISYIQSKRVNQLTNSEIESIQDNIKQYLLGNGISGSFTNDISAFIILNKNNPDFTLRLNDIKEGLVLYTGIRYTADLNELGKWDNELTIYLDTEIIFYFAGYNGDIYKDIFFDFYNLSKEINHNKKKKKIRLRYFKETEKEIIDFFHIATLIVEGKITLDPSKTAMKEIVNGCSSKSDVIQKRNKLFIDLKTAGIEEEIPHDYYQNHSFVIEDAKVISELKRISEDKKREFDEEKCNEYLKLFTKINVMRNGRNDLSFDRCGHIILTGNKFVHYLAHNSNIKSYERDIPFATDLDFVTDKFWFKLKKGFGKSGVRPKSFDIITKAQIVLSAQVNNTVQDKFTALSVKFDQGKISKEEAISLSYELRDSSLKPEEITEDSLDDKLAFINEFTIEEHILEREKLKQKVLEGEKAKNELRKRDRLERNKITKKIKRVFRFKLFLIVFGILLINSALLVSGYFALNWIAKPTDTTITLLGVLIGILSLFPIYRYSRKLVLFLINKMKLQYKIELNQIIKEKF